MGALGRIWVRASAVLVAKGAGLVAKGSGLQARGAGQNLVSAPPPSEIATFGPPYSTT